MGIEALIVAALVAIGASASAAAIIAPFIVGILTLAVTSVIGRLLAGPTFSPNDARQVDVSPSAPRNFVYGRAPIGGRIIYSLLEDNRYQWIVYALAGHEIEDIEAVWIEEQRYEFVPSDGRFRLNTSDEIDDVFRFYKQFGREDQQALFDLMNADDSEWTATHRARGVALAVVRWELDRDILSRGVPTNSTFWEVKGKKLYDPRKDGNFGGFGSHRINEPATWEWSDNPVLAWFDHQRGHSSNGQIVFGHGFYPADLYAQASPTVPRAVAEMIPFVIEQANIADENVPLKNGGTHKRYTIDAAFRTDLARDQIDEAFQQAVAGYAADGPTGNRLICGDASTPVATISNLSRISHPSIELISATDDAFNVARPQYLEPQAVWREFDAPPFRDIARITNDGRVRPRQIQLPHQTSGIRAQRLGKIALEKSRAGTSIGWADHLDMLGVNVLDRVTINDERLGIINETFRIVGREFIGDTGQAGVPVGLQFSAIAEPDAVYFWNPATDEQDLSTIAPIVVSTRLASPILSTSDNSTTNVITINWTQADARAETIEFRRNLIGANAAIPVVPGDINEVQNIINLNHGQATGAPVFLLTDIVGIPGMVQLFLRAVSSGSFSMHTSAAGANDASGTLDIVDITTAAGGFFSVYAGSVESAEIQTFQTGSGGSGSVFVQNRIDNAEYIIEAVARSTNISTSAATQAIVTT